jgi:hypothetical protein
MVGVIEGVTEIVGVIEGVIDMVGVIEGVMGGVGPQHTVPSHMHNVSSSTI